MTTETELKLAEAIVLVDELKAEVAAEKMNKKQVMKPLNYRFPSTIKSGIEMLSDSMGFSNSDIARSAMFIGLQKLKEAHEYDSKKANGIIQIQKIRASLSVKI